MPFGLNMDCKYEAVICTQEQNELQWKKGSTELTDGLKVIQQTWAKKSEKKRLHWLIQRLNHFRTMKPLETCLGFPALENSIIIFSSSIKAF